MRKLLMRATLNVCLLALFPGVTCYGTDAPPEYHAMKNPVHSTASVLAAAKSNFEDHCIPCHGNDGRGDGPLAADLKTRPKDLTSSKELSTLTDGEIFWLITTGKDPMPSFAQKLTDEERWGLVNLVRQISKTASTTGTGVRHVQASSHRPGK